MKMTFNLSEKKKWDIQGKKTVQFRGITLSTVAVLTLVGATSPFWSIWFDSTSTQRFLSFSNISTFLHVFGSHFALFCCASLIFWAKNFIPSEHQSIIKTINIIGGVFVAVSAYFLLWVFGPSEDFSQWVYEILFIILAIGTAFGMHALSKFVAHNNERERKIAEAAPELLQVAEMFKDHMVGNEMEKTMIYETVDKILDRLR